MHILDPLFNHGKLRFECENKPYGFTNKFDWDTEELLFEIYNNETDEEFYINDNHIDFNLDNSVSFKAYDAVDARTHSFEGYLYYNSVLVGTYFIELLKLGIDPSTIEEMCKNIT